MKKIFSFAKKKKGFSPNSSDTGSVLSVGYEIKEKDLSKIHKAASSGDLSKLKQLAKKNDLSQLDKENRTPLHIACANGHVEIVQFLVESKAKLNLCDNQNRSPLMKAVQCQQERCVVTLLEHNADPNLVDINGNTALHLAALIPSISMAVQLLEHEANVNAQNKDGCTPLTLAVTENHVEMAEFLLKEGADVNAADQGERTSLMIAACNGQISMVRLLLRYNADVTIKDEKGWTSDDYAVMNGHHACSHLIIEHGTKGKTQPSPSHFPSAGKKPAAILGSPRHMAQAGPALGQPATDREELQLSGAAEAGKVDEDDSQAESISRASRRGAGDSWPSSDEDDLDFSPKKTQKPNLKKLMSASQKGRTDVIADVDRSSSESQSEQESEGEAKRNSSLPVALPPTIALPNPASSSSPSFCKPPQATSTPPSHCKKDGISTEDDEEDEDEEEDDDDDDDEETKEDENEENKMNPKDVKRDFLSELGLEGGEEEEDSPWDSESGSDSPGKLQGVAHTPVKAHKVMASISEEKNEDLQDGGLEKKPVLKAQPAPVLPKPAEPKDDAVKNKDLMEELGLDDADDLEDASDWDTASTASRTIAGRKLASPSGEEPGERPPAAQSKAQGPPSPTARTPPLPSPRSSNPSATLQPQPHPRARRLLPAKAESEEESDWDSESGTPASSPRKTGKLQPNLPEDKAISKPDILPHPRQLSPEDGGSRGSVESKEEPHKERHAVDTSGLDVSNPTHVTPGESHSRSTQEEEGTRTGDKASEPWEKRYEKIWVEIEKREVKSQFKSVAAELKEKFGETQKDAGEPTLDAGSGEDEDEHGEGDAPFRTAEEESSEEEEIIRPAARAKSLVLLPIPEQRESGLEDSATEPAESPQSERRARRQSGSPQDPCSAESSQRGEPDRITEKQENKQFPALRLPGSDLKDSDTDLDVDAGNCGKRKKELDSEESSIGEPKLKLHPSKESKLCASAQRTHNETEAEAEDSEPSPSPSLHTNPSASLRYSDEELEEDRHRFQREVGKLRVALLDLEKEKAQLRKEVGTEKKSIISEVQRPGGLWDGEGSSRQSVQESQVVKPPQTSRKQQLSEKGNGVTPKDKTREGLPQRDSPKSPKSGSVASKQEGDGVNPGERNAQRPPPRPRQAAHANGDPLSVFDDSTVSEASEDDGRSAAAGNRGNKEASEREMADDLDELTQSSDTPTEDEVSPTSGYRNASLLIQQLDSSSVDSVSMVKLQNMFHEYERTIQRERGRYSLLADKVSRLEKDRAELRRALEETREGRSVLERRQVELETDLNNLKFALKQEQEKHRNAAMLYDKSREQLRKKEEQQRAEAEERQRTELAMRNLELEMRALVNNMKQLEEDRNEAQRMLNQERSARALQEGVLSSHLRKQKEIEEENRRNFNKSSEAMSQLSEASDRERELMQQSRGLQEESEALRERLEDVRRDLKLSEEALAQTVFQCNSQLSGLKAEASVAAAKLEHERQAREKLEAEAESARARLASALQEVERSQAGRAEAERALQRERDERQRAREKLDAEAAAQRDAVHGLSQRLGKAEAKANGLENECHRSALALTEKTLLLETAEREREQALARLAEPRAPPCWPSGSSAARRRPGRRRCRSGWARRRARTCSSASSWRRRTAGAR
ncbi:hypothetical protein ANANG_G00143110 [Anguilla anguilla]|uniref:CCDC144C-like coiled-coil domain-containing protein n=1 Tax=Anguilla anguilla TaxID=7936 RepID=A0A9D3MB61_ANGAN|nr:hypothetical protein ANANG_G00143110 [Anguilla anguilla]